MSALSFKLNVFLTLNNKYRNIANGIQLKPIETGFSMIILLSVKVKFGKKYTAAIYVLPISNVTDARPNETTDSQYPDSLFFQSRIPAAILINE